MANDLSDQIAQLCTQAAMIMEDVADDALTIGATSAAERTRRLRQLEHAAKRVSELIAAAIALDR